MSFRSIALLTLLLLGIASGITQASDSIQVGAIEQRVLVAKPDHDGDIWLSVKLDVRWKIKE